MPCGRECGRTCGGERGYSLVEVVVALCLLVIAVLGIFRVITGTVLTNAETRSRTFATAYAARKLEAARQANFDTLVNVGATTDAGGLGDPGLSSLGPGATWEQAVVSQTGSAGHLKSVTVTVRWRQAGAPTRVTLYTLAPRAGLAAIRAR